MSNKYNVDFCTYIGEQDVRVVASVIARQPAYLSGAPEDCYPEEAAEVDEYKVYIEGNGDDYELFIEDLGVYNRKTNEYQSVEDLIVEAILEQEG